MPAYNNDDTWEDIRQERFHCFLRFLFLQLSFFSLCLLWSKFGPHTHRRGKVIIIAGGSKEKRFPSPPVLMMMIIDRLRSRRIRHGSWSWRRKNMIYCRWFSVFGLNRNHRASFFASFSFFTENLFKMQPFQLEDNKNEGVLYILIHSNPQVVNLICLSLCQEVCEFFGLGEQKMDVSNCVCLHRFELRCPLLANFCWFKSTGYIVWQFVTQLRT